MVAAILLFCVAPPLAGGFDRLDDPLPPGAVLRLGSMGWRHGPGPGFAPPQLVPSPEGGFVLHCTGAGLRFHRRPRGAGRPCVADAASVRAVRFVDGGKGLLVARQVAGGSVSVQRYDWPSLRPGKAGAALAVGFDAALLFSPDGTHLALFDNRGRCRLATVGGPLGQVSDGLGAGQGACFAVDGAALAFLEKDKLRLVPVAGKLPPARRGRRWAAAPDEMFQPRASPDGKAFLLREGGALVLRGVDGRVAARAAGQGCAAFSPDGKTLAVAGPGGVLLLDAATLERKRRLAELPLDDYRAVAFSADGTEAYVAGRTVVRAVRVADGKRLFAHRGHESGVGVLAWSPDGTILATGGSDGTALAWDPRTGKPRPPMPGHGEGVASLAFSADGRTLAVGEGFAQEERLARVRLWDVRSAKRLREWVAAKQSVCCAGFMDDGKVMLTYGPLGQLRWWDSATGERLGEAEVLEYPRLLRPAPGRAALLWQQHGGLTALSLDGPTAKRAARGNKTFADSFAAVELPDGRLLVQAGSYLNWHDARGRMLRRKKFADLSRPVALSPDGTMLAHGAGRRIWLIEVKTGRWLASLAGDGARPRVAAFSPDGTRLATAGDEGTVLLWDIAQARLEHALSDWLDDGGSLAELRAKPRQASLLLARRLAPHAASEAAVWPWLPRLDDDSFAVRQEAMRRLQEQGPAAALALKAALAGNLSLEARRRVSRIVSKMDSQDEPIDAERATALLRLLGTPEAKQALERLAALGDGPLARAARKPR